MVAESVTVSAVVERQLASASLRGCTTARKPIGLRSARMVANTASPSGDVFSVVPIVVAVGNGCVGPSRSRIWRPSIDGFFGTLAMIAPSTSATRMLRPAPAAQAGSARVSASEVRGSVGLPSRGCDRGLRPDDRPAPRWCGWNRQ